jgi:type II secretory pathway pseudopilin PulG
MGRDSPIRPRRPRGRTCQPSTGFTLLELLVIVALIALLIALLLPLISGIAARGRDLKCQTNLRSIVQAMHVYAAENNDSMPWGFVWNRADPVTWDESPQNVRGEYVSWSTLVARATGGTAGVTADDTSANSRALFPPALQCPEAELARPHVVSYAASWLICPSPYYEAIAAGAPLPLGAMTRPPRRAQLHKDAAVVWDTGIIQDWDHDPRWRLGGDIDGQRIWRGALTPQFRFQTPGDVFGRIPPRAYGQTRPVMLDVGPHVFHNREPGALSVERWPYQGNLRFRHRRDTTCNVGFSDGSVRQFTARVNANLTVKSHDALRQYFMLKWPPGVPPDPSVPH